MGPATRLAPHGVLQERNRANLKVRPYRVALETTDEQTTENLQGRTFRFALSDFVNRDRPVLEDRRQLIRNRVEAIFNARMRVALGRTDDDVVDVGARGALVGEQWRLLVDQPNLRRRLLVLRERDHRDRN